MKKLAFSFLLFLACINCHATTPDNQILVSIISGQVSSVSLSTYSFAYSIGEEAATVHTGTGTTKSFLIDISIVFQSTSATIPHTAQLTTSYYEDGAFFATNSTSKHKIVIYKNFNTDGSAIDFTPITPTSSTTTLRTASTTLSESHELHFYMVQDDSNSFYGGDYTSVFTFIFYIP
jgi:hypothetical protein